MDEDWEVLSSLPPSDWREQAAAQGALKGLRKDKSPDALLRTLLMHLGCGHSLRETAARARQAGIADVSVVALFKRLRKSKEWLRALCVGMYRECGVELGASEGLQVRAFDGSLVAEPGRTGSLWRVHYGLRLPALACDHFEVTKAKGEGCGETLKRFPIGRGDHVVADRGYSTAGGLMHVEAAGGYATVRVNTRSLRFRTPGGRRPFDLLAAVSTIKRAGTVRSWRARAVGRDGKGVVGRVCAMKKSAEDARQAREKLRRRAVHKGRELQPETLEFAGYVIVFTTFPAERFPAAEVLRWYRVRWQVELTFKRFKSLAGLGHLPKRSDDSALAWLYGKLLVALMAEKLARHAESRAVSPSGASRNPVAQSLAGVQVRAEPGVPSRRTSAFPCRNAGRMARHFGLAGRISTPQKVADVTIL